MRSLEELEKLNDEAYRKFIIREERKKMALFQDVEDVSVFCPICENLLHIDIQKAEAKIGVAG